MFLVLPAWRFFTAQLALLLLVTPSLVMAADTDKVSALLDQSGFTEQVKTWPDMVRAEIRLQGEITDDNLDLILRRADSDTLVTQLQASVHKHVSEALSVKEINAVSSWYHSALGKQITHEEMQAATQQGIQEMAQQADSLRQDSARVARMRQLDTLSGTTDNSLALHYHSAKAVAKAIPGNTPVDLADDTALRDKVEKRVDLAFLYTYRNLDDATLERYQAFLASEPAQRFHHAIHAGMTAAFVQEIDQWADQLHDAMSAINTD